MYNRNYTGFIIIGLWESFSEIDYSPKRSHQIFIWPFWSMWIFKYMSRDSHWLVPRLKNVLEKPWKPFRKTINRPSQKIKSVPLKKSARLHRRKVKDDLGFLSHTTVSVLQSHQKSRAVENTKLHSVSQNFHFSSTRLLSAFYQYLCSQERGSCH